MKLLFYRSSSNKEHFSSKVGKFSPHSHKKRTGTNVSLISIDDDLEMSPLLSPDVARLRYVIWFKDFLVIFH